MRSATVFFISVAVLHYANGEGVLSSVSARGILQKQGMLRSETIEAVKHVDEHKYHHVQHAKTLFKAMDTNGDGKLSSSEVAASIQRSDMHIPKALKETWTHIDNERELSYEDFMAGVHALSEAHVHHSLAELNEDQSARQAAVREHGANSPSGASEDGWVSCGGHRAPTCGDCPFYKNGVKGSVDHGFEYCNGDCSYKGNTCSKNDGTAAGSTGVPSNGHATPASQQADSKLPDLQQRNITDYDNKVISHAARDAVAEEVKEQDMKAQKEEEEKDFDSRKFWFVMVIIFSVFVGICVIATITSACVFMFMSQSDDETSKDVEDEKDALAEADADEVATANES